MWPRLPKALLPFSTKVLTWLPMTFFAWYGLTDEITWVLGWALAGLCAWILPQSVEQIQALGMELMVVTTYPMVESGRFVLVVREPTATLGWGLPLYVGLLLASPDEGWVLVKRLALGCVLVILTQFLAIVIYLFTYLHLDGHIVFKEYGRLPWFFDTFLYVVDEIGRLVLPGLVPILLWVGLHQEFVADLVGLKND